MSSANRERRRQNQATKLSAAEESLRRARRQRIILTGVGIALAIVVAVALVARAKSDSGNKASSSTTTTAADTSTTAATTTTVLASVAGKPCVAMSSPVPAGAPAVPVQVGPAPKTLVKQDLKTGTGAVVKPGATVTVNYIGVACSSGKVFGSSFGNKEPFTTPLGEVIPGWTDGIPGMRVGGQRLLGIPAAMAYGPATRPGIAPNESLWFVVQVDKAK